LIQNKTVETLLALPYPQGPSCWPRKLAAGFAAGYDKYLSDIGGFERDHRPSLRSREMGAAIKPIDVWRLMSRLDLKAGAAPRAALCSRRRIRRPARPLARKAHTAATGQAVAETEEQLGQEISLPGSNGLCIAAKTLPTAVAW